jgi:hypothetical protein
MIRNNETGCHGPFREVDTGMRTGKSDQGAADLRACGIPIGVEYAGVRMRGFASTQQLAIAAIEGRAPLDQLSNAQWPIFNENLRSRAENKTVAGSDGVFEMKRHVSLAFRCDCDAALSVVRIRLTEGLFGDD